MSQDGLLRISLQPELKARTLEVFNQGDLGMSTTGSRISEGDVVACRSTMSGTHQ
jgi:hypothetical protein